MKSFFYSLLALSVAATTTEAQVGNDALDAATRKHMAERDAANTPAPESPLRLPHQERAKEITDLAYNTWRVSHSNGGNLVAWENCTTRSRIRKVRNLIISQRGQYPQDYFREAQYMPSLDHFTYVGAVASCEGRTLAATYFGKMQLGENGKPEDAAFVVLLVQEDGRWKVDQTRFFTLTRIPEVRKRLLARDTKVLLEQDGFHPYRAIPSAPPLCPAPQLIGKIFVDCPGREIDLKINGISMHEFYDERRADVISGGLRRGANTISYTIRDLDGKERPAMAIGLFVMPETPGNTPVCVYDHILDGSDSAKSGSFTFNISNTQIASMNPKFKGEKPEPFHAVPLKQKPQQDAPQKSGPTAPAPPAPQPR